MTSASQTSPAHTGSLPLVLLPGLGGDARMFAPQRERFPGLQVIEWERPRRADTVSSYARRVAEKLPGGPFVLGGVSFGGAVAWEAATIRPPAGLVLLSALCSAKEIVAPLRPARHLPPIVHDVATRVSRHLAGLVAPFHGCAGPERRLVAEMFASADPGFISWARRMSLRWDPPPPPPVPTLRIHGTRDCLVRPVRPADTVWVRGAGHLLTMTHPRPVNDAIERFLGELRIDKTAGNV